MPIYFARRGTEYQLSEHQAGRAALSRALAEAAAFDSRTDPDAPRPDVDEVEAEPLVKFIASVFRVRVRIVALAVLRVRAGGATPDGRALSLLGQSNYYRRE